MDPSRNRVSQLLREKSGEKEQPRSDDDALRHAERSICGHLLVTQMTHWEAERAMFCSTDL